MRTSHSPRTRMHIVVLTPEPIRIPILAGLSPAVVLAPKPILTYAYTSYVQAMRREHVDAVDSKFPFHAGNYGESDLLAEVEVK